MPRLKKWLRHWGQASRSVSIAELLAAHFLAAIFELGFCLYTSFSFYCFSIKVNVSISTSGFIHIFLAHTYFSSLIETVLWCGLSVHIYICLCVRLSVRYVRQSVSQSPSLPLFLPFSHFIPSFISIREKRGKGKKKREREKRRIAWNENRELELSTGSEIGLA